MSARPQCLKCLADMRIGQTICQRCGADAFTPQGRAILDCIPKMPNPYAALRGHPHAGEEE